MKSFSPGSSATIGQMSARIYGQPRLRFPSSSRVAINLEPSAELLCHPNSIWNREFVMRCSVTDS
jgi:hypothetical protein